MEMVLLIIINTVVVSLAVVIHFEALLLLGHVIPKSRFAIRFRLLIGVFGVLIAHVMEIFLFALTFHVISHNTLWGQLEGNYSGEFVDSMYFSFTTFSTLGFGDIQPVGELRYLAGIESLTGLLLIAWSASFLFLLMERHWMKSQIERAKDVKNEISM
jgi:hypothetical protein